MAEENHGTTNVESQSATDGGWTFDDWREAEVLGDNETLMPRACGFFAVKIEKGADYRNFYCAKGRNDRI